MNKIAIIGTGYVGLVTGVCFAQNEDNHVICVDKDNSKIERLKKGEPTIYENQLKYYLNKAIYSKHIEFTTNLDYAVGESDIIFIAVGTPSKLDGSVDLSYVYSVVDEIIKAQQKYEKELTVVVKSTVPPGTCEKIQDKFNDALSNYYLLTFVVSNPEFLKEGVAIDDFMNPDRIVIGSPKNCGNINTLYCYDVKPDTELLICDNTVTAELIKYASNAMLATRISFMNEIANIANLVGADITKVEKGIGLDKRIGDKFLKPGCGYGGSCFPKDVLGLIDLSKQLELPSYVIQATYESNLLQKRMISKILAKEIEYHTLYPRDMKVAIWGVSFKPNTDDIREAPALSTIDHLLWQYDFKEIAVYDPKAIPNLKKELGEKSNRITYGNNMYDILDGANFLIIHTDWDMFINADLEKVECLMNGGTIIDGRNIFINKQIEKEYNLKYKHI